jgi:hypothetical protein
MQPHTHGLFAQGQQPYTSSKTDGCCQLPVYCQAGLLCSAVLESCCFR